MSKIVLALCLAGIAACGDTTARNDDPGSNGSGGVGGQTTGTGGGGGETTGGGGPTEEELAACQDVCFYWENPAPLSPVDAPSESIIEDCNAYGLTPAICPSGFVCGRVIESPIFGTLPVCEPATSGSITTTFDLPAATPPANAHDVTLHLTMNGGAWPSPGDGKNAGVLTLIRNDDEWSQTVPLPTDASGVLNLRLPPGLYTAAFATSGADLDRTQYPEGYKLGLLQVVDDGAATANLERHLLHWTVEIDNVAETLAGQFATLKFRGRYWQSSTFLADGESMSGTLALYPDTYSVATDVYGSGTIPEGHAALEDAFALGPGQSSVTWDVLTVQVTGTVLVDGQGFAGSPTDVDIQFEGEDGNGPRTELVAGTPGTFAARLLPGTYDVSLNVGYSAESRLPRGGALLRADYETGSGSIDAALSTLTVSGSVTINNGPLGDAGYGRVDFKPRSGRATTLSLSLSSTEPATFSGTVFREGRYEVSAYGNGLSLPQVHYPLRSDYRPSSTPLALNVNAHLVTIPVTLDGSSLPDAPTEYSRGAVVLTSQDLTTPVSLTNSVPSTGSASVQMLVPQGSWELGYFNYSSTYSDAPYGTFAGNTITVARPGTHPLDLHGIALTIHLTQGGMEPPPAGAGKSRGSLYAFSKTLPVPGSGPATVNMLLFPQVGYASLSCLSSSPECDSTWIEPRNFLILGYGLELR